ncbi:MAG: putative Ig domain-containing protein [Thermoplasmata archaeon]|nr:putative Ig domain-containing protein [Thermoplasmata archaeon]
MKQKLTSIFIVSILILSILLINWNFVNSQTNTNDDYEFISDSRNINRQSSNTYDWDLIEVISEPIFGLDNNDNISFYTRVVVENDKIYVVWDDETDIDGAGGDGDIFFRFYDGNIWSDIQVISEPVFGENRNTRYSSRPDIAVENGKIYVVWTDLNNTNGAGTDEDVFFRCNLTGLGWEDIQVISEPNYLQNTNTGRSVYPTIKVESSKLYVVWADETDTFNSGTDFDVFIRCNLTGNYWEDIQIISEPIEGKSYNTEQSRASEFDVENGKIYVVWVDYNNTNGAGGDSDIFIKCNLTGTSWEKVQIISEPVYGQDFNKAISTAPAIDVNNNKIYVVWTDLNNTNGAGTDDDIFYRCNLTGTNWENIQVISEPIAGNNFNIEQNWYPEISIENNKIHVVWDDENNTNGAGTDADIFYRCNLTGHHWEPIQVISEPVLGNNINQAFSSEADIAVNQDRVYIVWGDENDTNGAGTDRDVFLRFSSPPLYFKNADVAPISGNTSSHFNFTINYFHKHNKSPVEINVNISGVIYSMLETDLDDVNYKDGKNYFYNTTLNISENHTFQFSASDDNYTILTKIFNNPDVLNTPPLILTQNNLTAYEDVYYEMQYQYSDIDAVNINQQMTWKFNTNAAWLNFNSITATLFGTPINNDVGQYWVNISINDTLDLDYTNFILTVIEVNDNPVINTTNIGIAYEDAMYFIDYNATDIDSPIENQLWSLTTDGGSWLYFDQITGILNGTPINQDVGSYWVNVTVNDNEDGIGFTNFTLEVINVNDPPSIIEIDPLDATAEKYYEQDFNATDIDSSISKQTWSLITNATWLTINSATGIISGTPTVIDVGWYNVNITVNDGDGGTDWFEFIFYVLSIYINDSPDIITDDDTSAVVNEYYYTDYNAIDDHTPVNDLKWYLSTNASWLTINLNSGLLSGTPTMDDVGSYWVSVSVFDGEGGWDYHNFTLRVTKVPIIENHAPVLSDPKMEPLEGTTETNFTFSIVYLDEDNDAPKYVRLLIGGKMYELELKTGDVYNGVYGCNIKLSEGNHTYYFTAFDGQELTRTEDLETSNIKGKGEISKDESSMDWLVWVIVIIIIIIILLILLFVFIRSKKRKEKQLKEDRLLEEPLTPERPEEQPSLQMQTPQVEEPRPQLVSPPQITQVQSIEPKPQIPQLASPVIKDPQEQPIMDYSEE